MIFDQAQNISTFLSSVKEQCQKEHMFIVKRDVAYSKEWKSLNMHFFKSKLFLHTPWMHTGEVEVWFYTFLTRWTWVVRLSSPLLYLREESSRYLLNGRQVWPNCRSSLFGETFFAPNEIRTPDCPACSKVSIVLTLSRLRKFFTML
jgi:hypothetical protein